jgi:hypothetical protein
MSNTQMKNIPKMLSTTSMVASSMAKRSMLFSPLSLTSSTLSANNTLMEVASVVAIATTCMSNLFQKVSRRIYSQGCILNIPSIAQRRDLKVRTSSSRGKRKREESRRIKSIKRSMPRKDRSQVSAKSLRSIKSIKTNLDHAPVLRHRETSHRKEGTSSQSGTRSSIND